MKSAASTPKIDRPLLITVLALIVFGLIAVSSASSVVSFERYGNNNYYLFRQALFVAAGLAIIFLFSKIDYRFWKRWSGLLIILAILALAAVLVPGIGHQPGAARRWFSFGSFLIQPSEFLKLAMIFYLAAWFEKKPGAEINFWYGVLPPLLVSGLGIGLVILEPDIGTVLILGAILAVILFAARVRLRYLVVFLGMAVGALLVLIKVAPYRAQRIATFLNPANDPQGISYHINQALLAIGSGGFWGYGFGASRQKHNYLPEPIGDSIFAVMAEELGFARIVLVILAFVYLAIRGLKVAAKAPDRFGQLAACGITGWIVVQALINIGAISGLLPLTGIPLPFISYGGSSLLILCAAVGTLLNISKHRV